MVGAGVRGDGDFTGGDISGRGQQSSSFMVVLDRIGVDVGCVDDFVFGSAEAR